MAKMIDIQDQHDGELKVYRREEADGTVSDFWYYQINIPNHQRIRHKSTKERELASALMAANVQYQKLKQRAMMGLSIASFHSNRSTKMLVNITSNVIKRVCWIKRDFIVFKSLLNAFSFLIFRMNCSVTFQR